MGNDKVTECINMLSIIYDKAIHLKNNLFYVAINKESKIVNEYGEIVRELNYDTVNFERCGPGWVISFNNGLIGTQNSLIGTQNSLIVIDELNEISEMKGLYKYKHIGDNVYAALFYEDYYFALYGKDFKKLTPNIYENVYIERESVNHINVKVRKKHTRFIQDEYSIIRVDKEGTAVSHLFSENIGGQEEYKALAITAKSNGKYLYALGRNGERLTTKTFSSFTCSNRSIDRGLIEVWDETVVKNYKGLISLSGTILIDTGKYGDIEETPFRDLFIVTTAMDRWSKENKKIGIFQLERGEVIPCGAFKEKGLTKLNIITFEHTETGKTMYLGNDRNIHLEIDKAFPIFRLNREDIKEEFYMINVYGVWYTIDRDFNTININIELLDIKSSDWVRI